MGVAIAKPTDYEIRRKPTIKEHNPNNNSGKKVANADIALIEVDIEPKRLRSVMWLGLVTRMKETGLATNHASNRKGK